MQNTKATTTKLIDVVKPSLKVYIGCYYAKVIGVFPPSNPLSSIRTAKVEQPSSNLIKIELQEPFTATINGTIKMSELLKFELDKPNCQILKLTAYTDEARTNLLSQGKLPLFMESNPVFQDKATGLLETTMPFSYKNDTAKPWKIFMRAETDRKVPEFYSTLNFELEFSYFVTPDTLPKFRSSPKFDHEVKAEFDEKNNLETSTVTYEYLSPKLEHP